MTQEAFTIPGTCHLTPLLGPYGAHNVLSIHLPILSVLDKMATDFGIDIRLLLLFELARLGVMCVLFTIIRSIIVNTCHVVNYNIFGLFGII